MEFENYLLNRSINAHLNFNFSRHQANIPLSIPIINYEFKDLIPSRKYQWTQHQKGIPNNQNSQDSTAVHFQRSPKIQDFQRLIILLECIKTLKHQIPQKHLYQILRRTMRIKKIQPQSFLQSPSRWMTGSKWRRPNHRPFLNIHQDGQ